MTTFSGATKQSLARLLDREATHTVIDSLFLRYDVPPLSADTNANKLRKANHLVQQLAGRVGGRDFLDLVQYVGSTSSGLSAAFRRGSVESVDFYANLDRDTPAKAAPQPRVERTFARPGTTAPAPPPSPTPATARRYVFVVRGRDHDAYNALVALLTSLDLRVVTWDEASSSAGGGTPNTLDIVRAGIEMSNAVVVLMTPDDVGHVKGDFYDPVRDDPREARPTGQVRQNVVFEAGWAMALNQDGVILVRVGDVRPLSDIEGLNYVWLDNDIGSRRQFISRLRNCRLEVHDNHDRWRTAGTFPER